MCTKYCLLQFSRSLGEKLAVLEQRNTRIESYTHKSISGITSVIVVSLNLGVVSGNVYQWSPVELKYEHLIWRKSHVAAMVPYDQKKKWYLSDCVLCVNQLIIPDGTFQVTVGKLTEWGWILRSFSSHLHGDSAACAVSVSRWYLRFKCEK